ncbi:hypothetical protein [Bradyrhizobium sp. TM239]|uniref:hypothetical protein n=1 Tax=Bradyrhizobium sp. TM239 TaxID=2599802 RepID=UPI0030C7855C
MVDEVVLKNATETAWSVYRAHHPEIDPQDSRRCLLERHLQRRGEERESDTEELAGLRDCLPAPILPGRMLRTLKMLVARVARGTTRPYWTLLAISFLISAVFVVGLRIAFGA